MVEMTRLRTPTGVNLDLTPFCNLRCSFCASPREVTDYFSFEPKERLFRILDILKEADVFRMNLFGGEPFLHPAAVDVAEYAKELGFAVCFVTNGTLLKKEMVHRLDGVADVGTVSIHGFGPTHDSIVGVASSYKGALNVLSMLCDTSIVTGVNCTIIKQNYSSVFDFAEFLVNSYNIKYFEINRYLPLDPTPGVRERFEPTRQQINHVLKGLQKLKRRYTKTHFEAAVDIPFCILDDPSLKELCGTCTAGVTFCSIAANGDVKLCSFTNFVFGNIFERPLEEIWQEMDFIKLYRKADWIKDECKECPDILHCFCGCKVTLPNVPFSVDVLMCRHTQ